MGEPSVQQANLSRCIANNYYVLTKDSNWHRLIFYLLGKPNGAPSPHTLFI